MKPSPPRTLRSAPSQLVDVAERRRLERADRRARREQRVARLRAAVVEREQQRGDAVLVAGVGEPGLVRQAIVSEVVAGPSRIGSNAIEFRARGPDSTRRRSTCCAACAARTPPRASRRRQLSALSVVVFGGPLTLGGLAEAEQVRSPTMTRIVTALETRRRS